MIFKRIFLSREDSARRYRSKSRGVLAAGVFKIFTIIFTLIENKYLQLKRFLFSCKNRIRTPTAQDTKWASESAVLDCTGGPPTP